MSEVCLGAGPQLGQLKDNFIDLFWGNCIRYYGENILLLFLLELSAN